MISNSVGISTTGDVNITLHMDETLLKRFAEKKTLSLKINIHCGSKNNSIIQVGNGETSKQEVPAIPIRKEVSKDLRVELNDDTEVSKDVVHVENGEPIKEDVPAAPVQNEMSKDLRIELNDDTEVSKDGVFLSW